MLVAHDGAAWLPTALQALALSTALPGQVVLVDTASTDHSAALLQVVGPVLHLPRDTGYGAAVAAALATVPPTPWLWLLHDDAAPDPDALAVLLQRLQIDESVAMVGPKSRDWYDERVLVEVGLTTDPSGHRHTGLDPREWDQGQRDAEREVLAVGTAGALVRRSAWDALGGLDPALPIYRDDLDLGWRLNAAGRRVLVVPAAGQRHARAATTGRRAPGAVTGRAATLDRRHAVHVLLAHAPRRALPVLLPALLLSSLVRALGLLLGRQPRAAVDELTVLPHVLLPPDRLRAARRARRVTSVRTARELRPLLAGRTERLRVRAEAARSWCTARATAALGGPALSLPDPYAALGDAGPEGPDAQSDLRAVRPGIVRLLLRQPFVQLIAALTAVTVVAERGLLHGGALFGGRLLPLPPGAGDLWSSYAASWQTTGVGSPAPAHPVVGAMAALSTVLLGRPGLAVDLLLLGAVPLAGATAYVAAGAVSTSALRRVWAAATWALLPVATTGIATGRLDVAAGQIALPLLLVKAWTLVRRPDRRGWALGLGLALVAAVSPLLWPLTAAGLLGLALGHRRGRAAALRTCAVPAVLLGPWAVAAGWSAVLAGPGVELPGGPHPLWQLVLLQSAGPATWWAAGLVVAALAGLLHPSRATTARGAWLLALGGLSLAVALTRSGHDPAVGLQLAGAGVLVAALVASEGWTARLAGTSFGWRQPAAAGLVGLTLLAPVLAAGAWVADGAEGPLTRTRLPVLPAFAEAELAASPGLRALALRAGTEGAVRYDLSAGGGPHFGAAETPPTPEQRQALDAVVADLVSPRGTDAAEALATRAVRFVALPPGPDTAAIAAALDGQEGLARRSSDPVLLWRVLAPAARLTVLTGATAEAARGGARAASLQEQRLAPARPLGPGDRVDIGPGRPGRIVVLAEAFDSGWKASYDGVALAPVRAWGWAQAFALPASAGRLQVEHSSRRTTTVWLQALGLATIAVLAGPGARRRTGLDAA